MNERLKIYVLDNDYVSYLRKYDLRIPYNKKGTRPFIGVVYKYNNFLYFAPMSSPKIKHLKISNNAIDVFKIANGELGIININNMIPVPKNCLKELLPYVRDEKYMGLLVTQLEWINKNRKSLLHKVNVFYKLYTDKLLNKNQINRSCDFKLLEEKCLEYNHEKITN